METKKEIRKIVDKIGNQIMKCDRCKKEFKFKQGVQIDNNTFFCDDCYNKVMEFIERQMNKNQIKNIAWTFIGYFLGAITTTIILYISKG